jgi:transposase, IS6 family
MSSSSTRAAAGWLGPGFGKGWMGWMGCLGCRDVEELLAERGVEVDHVTVYGWVQRFTPLFADAARPLRRATGDRWFVDETYVKVAGRWRHLYRAVDQYGQVIDVMLSEQRDTPTARRFFTRALR